jgi:hypothetical protein
LSPLDAARSSDAKGGICAILVRRDHGLDVIVASVGCCTAAQMISVSKETLLFNISHAELGPSPVNHEQEAIRIQWPLVSNKLWTSEKHLMVDTDHRVQVRVEMERLQCCEASLIAKPLFGLVYRVYHSHNRNNFISDEMSLD